VEQLSEHLKNTIIFSAPPELVDDYMDLLEHDITKVLDIMAPLQARTKWLAGRPTAKWMTPEGAQVKKFADTTIVILSHRIQLKIT